MATTIGGRYLRCSFYISRGKQGHNSHQCLRKAVWRMKVAPNGTAYPARASLLLCGLHEGMRLGGTLEATYILVGEPSRID